LRDIAKYVNDIKNNNSLSYAIISSMQSSFVKQLNLIQVFENVG